MSFSGASGLNLKKFVSQDEVDDKRKKRQEEWEKVRKPDDPEEFPEEPVDNRSLYDRLEEQRQKQQDEFEEKVAFRNQVRRLDEDEVEFLDFVSETQQEMSKVRNQEEAEIISELQLLESSSRDDSNKWSNIGFDQEITHDVNRGKDPDKSAKVVRVADQKPEEKKSKPVTQQSSKKSQMKLLAGAVKRKGSEEGSPPKKARVETEVDKAEKEEEKGQGDTRSDAKPTSTNTNNDDKKPITKYSVPLARVIGIRPSALAGLTQYEDSSDSQSSSSDSEIEMPAPVRVVYVKQNAQQH